MKRKSLITGILFAVFFITYCGENGLEVGSITEPALDANFSKKSDQWLSGSEILSMRPVVDKFSFESISESKSRRVKKIVGIDKIVVTFPHQANEKYTITGDIENLVIEQDVVDGNPGLGRVLSIKGNIEWAKVEERSPKKKQ